jgi:hypothetical protein
MILSNLELSIFNNIKDKKPEITFCSRLHDNELTNVKLTTPMLCMLIH